MEGKLIAAKHSRAKKAKSDADKEIHRVRVVNIIGFSVRKSRCISTRSTSQWDDKITFSSSLCQGGRYSTYSYRHKARLAIKPCCIISQGILEGSTILFGWHFRFWLYPFSRWERTGANWGPLWGAEYGMWQGHSVHLPLDHIRHGPAVLGYWNTGILPTKWGEIHNRHPSLLLHELRRLENERDLRSAQLEFHDCGEKRGAKTRGDNAR